MWKSGLGLRCESILATRDRSRICGQVHWPIQAWKRVLAGKVGLNRLGWKEMVKKMARRQQGEGIDEENHETWGRR